MSENDVPEDELAWPRARRDLVENLEESVLGTNVPLEEKDGFQFRMWAQLLIADVVGLTGEARLNTELRTAIDQVLHAYWDRIKAGKSS